MTIWGTPLAEAVDSKNSASGCSESNLSIFHNLPSFSTRNKDSKSTERTFKNFIHFKAKPLIWYITLKESTNSEDCLSLTESLH